MAIRTKRLAIANSTTSFVVIYQCPSGHTAIIKTVWSIHNGTTSSHLQLYTLDSGAAVAVTLLDVTTAVSAEIHTLETWHVLEPGDQLLFRGTAAVNTWSVWVSGAELAGTA